jgi:hypothetical protein
LNLQIVASEVASACCRMLELCFIKPVTHTFTFDWCFGWTEFSVCFDQKSRRQVLLICSWSIWKRSLLSCAFFCADVGYNLCSI